MRVNYKFNIGDMVRVIKEMPYRLCCSRKIKVGSEFPIREFGWNHTNTANDYLKLLEIIQRCTLVTNRRG